MTEEVVIKLEGGDPPPVETPAVVVVETPAETPSGGDVLGAAVVVMSLESLAAENAALRERVESLESSRQFMSEQIGSLQVAQIVDEVDDEIEETGLVREEIPAEAPAETKPPEERKKSSRFV